MSESSVGWGAPVMFDANAVALKNAQNTQVIKSMQETNERMEAEQEKIREKKQAERQSQSRLVDVYA